VGGAELKVTRERNIRWLSEDGKLQFSLEYDNVEDTENGFKFFTGRATLETDSGQEKLMVFVNIAHYHDIYLMPWEDAIDSIPETNWEENFPILLNVNFIKDVFGLFISDITVLEGTAQFNNTDISYFDDFDQKISWEPLSDDEKNPLNYFMRTWINEDNGLSFTQDSPKLFIEQKLRGTLSDESPVLLAFGEDDFTLYRYEDAVEGDILLEGTYTTAVSSISLNVITNNLYQENPGVIVLE